MGKFTANVSMIIALSFVTGCKNSALTYPLGAPKIESGFGSYIGVNGGVRIAAHQGIDIIGNEGQEILAVADGIVLEATVESCWGPTIAVDHGNAIDNNKIIALYGHLGEMLVGEGDLVKRGELIARLGNNQDNFECIWGIRHLHFQIGQKYRDQSNKGTYWGHSYFLEDGNRGLDPHLYWAEGPNVITCYEPNKQYKNGTITYPVPCR